MYFFFTSSYNNIGFTCRELRKIRGKILVFDWEGKIFGVRVIKGVGALETDDLRSGFFCFFFLRREGK